MRQKYSTRITLAMGAAMILLSALFALFGNMPGG